MVILGKELSVPIKINQKKRWITRYSLCIKWIFYYYITVVSYICKFVVYCDGFILKEIYFWLNFLVEKFSHGIKLSRVILKSQLARFDVICEMSNTFAIIDALQNEWIWFIIFLMIKSWERITNVVRFDCKIFWF